MSKWIVGDHLWAEMTEGQKLDAVLRGHATLKQMSEGLLDGSEALRRACQDSLARTSPSFENLPAESEPDRESDIADETVISAQDHLLQSRSVRKVKRRPPASAVKQRFGLPNGFVPRLQRFGRSVLLELNVYRLPDGQEFIPSVPVGTLGTRQHSYALLTTEQYLSGKRGSVYIRSDGRIFDYSVDANPVGDFFDTGYTIHDLERTGQYAPLLRKKRKKRKKVQPARYRRAAAAGAMSN
jgi:hypothetical protein